MSLVNGNEESELAGKVLFVDNEKSILKSIQRGFFCAEFETITASGISESLEILAKENIDIVISDFCMPEMDGIEFLKIVKKRYPNISRVILSGFVEQSAVIKSLVSGVTTIYLTKPWDNEVLKGRINHILKIRKILKSNKLLKIINSINQLPTPSSLYQEVLNAIEHEKPIIEITKIIQKDMSISTKILQIANSAFYGLQEESSLGHAISYIGLKQIKSIVFTASLITNMSWSQEQKEHLKDILFHSGVVNHFIPKVYNSRTDVEKIKQFPAIGLTHDIGKIIILQYFPDLYLKIIKRMKDDPYLTFHKSELELGSHNVSHTEIGAYFLDWWNLPDILVEIALFHHTIEKSIGHWKKLLEVTNFVDDVVTFLINLKVRNDKIDLEKLHYNFLPEKKIEEIIAEIKKNIDVHYNRK